MVLIGKPLNTKLDQEASETELKTIEDMEVWKVIDRPTGVKVMASPCVFFFHGEHALITDAHGDAFADVH